MPKAWYARPELAPPPPQAAHGGPRRFAALRAARWAAVAQPLWRPQAVTPRTETVPVRPAPQIGLRSRSRSSRALGGSMQDARAAVLDDPQEGSLRRIPHPPR